METDFYGSIDVGACGEGIDRDRGGGIRLVRLLENVKDGDAECVVEDLSGILLRGGGRTDDVDDGNCN
jgi:hypothetical protein